jgi:tRNA pseudouridine38-40 synthase
VGPAPADPVEAAPAGAGDPVRPPVRWRLRLAYDGSGFRGFAAQPPHDGLPEVPTVAGALVDALTRVTRTEVSLTCAGRTDAGVHALDQVVHLDLPAGVADRLDPAAVVRSLNKQLAPSVVVREAGPVAPAFDARRSAVARRYRYLVVNGPVADPLLAPLTWHVADPLDLRALSAAADALLGEHDFRAFCRRVPGTSADEPIHRRVTETRWSEVTGSPESALVPVTGRLLAFEIEANAFCHQMVRSLVGTLVDVGRGRRRASDMLWILRSADRGQASQPAPPGGLTLLAVRYPPDPASPEPT